MELLIFIKNVGQGDSIFLEWQDNISKDKKHGLIDCNKFNGNIDCITKHIEDRNINGFEFVINSHPHSDHFSGFRDFFKYCVMNDIIIQKFLFSGGITPEFLVAENSPYVQFEGHRKLLKNIYKDIVLLYEESKQGHSILIDLDQISGATPITLFGNVKLRFLAPHRGDEIKEFNNQQLIIANQKLEFKSENKPSANLLSTFIQIYDDIDKWQVWLTSDTTSSTFNKLSTYKKYFIDDKTLLASQIPHHGSLCNHNSTFWDLSQDLGTTQAIETKNPIPCVLSVGNGYNHPDSEVVKYFDENDKFDLHSTNYVGGYKQYFENKSNHEDNLPLLQAINLLTNEEEMSNTDSRQNFCCEKVLIIKKNDYGKISCKVKDFELI